jgi:hypothetical protein
LITTEFDIRITEERAKIIEGISKTHSLKIDEKGFPVTDHQILRLEIPVNETSDRSEEPFCQTRKLCLELPLELWPKFDPANISDKMISEVIPLPPIEIRAETLRESHTLEREILFGKGVKSVGNVKCLLVKSSSVFPRVSSERPEVCIAEVLRDDETVGWIVADYLRYGDIDLVEKLGNVSVVSIFYTFRIVMDQDR